ncbi:hypothetical protein J4E83_005223 [Alternaria metachromatica]|uniref:uncharacterized protein n=1 Tax=Alternaria metachromatica TaxID=283354 RepID=UPI0020C483CE|nr:uncharacterized protein J4E83_005223 [Alternaria metachromatica]KAI4619989.1 hypothetical protein J4E80_004514 [Alternaria sp. BMP 0032]KAI4620861.1 hypothetical protein J4E83_005223 [Alternaria metachromatica]
MDPPDRTVDSGGGAVFQGDITAGRDITINQITEIRQVAEHLSSRCNETNNSHKLLGSLEALSVFAKYTEDYANTLDTSVLSSDLHFGRVSEECASILRELKLLVETLEQGELGGYEPSPSFGENVLDLRSRLTSLQSHLNIVSNRKAQKDYSTIKETLTQLVNSLTNGGGVKSWSSLLIIKALMEEVIACENRFERQFTHYPRSFEAADFRPCHYFHKMYGTSTGGILAIALSRLRMTVSETITAFDKILSEMYTHVRTRVTLVKKYHNIPMRKGLEAVAQQYCKQHELGQCSQEDKFRWRAPINDDQGICLAAVRSGQLDEAYLLRTYSHHYDPDIAPPWVTPYNQDTLDLNTWEVGRGTTATPFRFDMLVVNGPDGRLGLKDGGIRENNPSYCAYSEAASLWGDDNEPSLLLSIGAGQTSSKSDDLSLSGILPIRLSALNKYAGKLAVFKNTLIKYTEGQDRHKMMRTIARGGHTWYKRFEVTGGLEKIGADQWEPGMMLSTGGHETMRPGGKTLNTINTATEVYLSRQEPDRSVNEYAAPQQMLRQTAEKLVRMRRARELEAMTQGGEKREHWEAFMGKHLIGERDFFRKYQEEWDYALLGRKN